MYKRVFFIFLFLSLFGCNLSDNEIIRTESLNQLGPEIVKKMNDFNSFNLDDFNSLFYFDQSTRNNFNNCSDIKNYGKLEKLEKYKKYFFELKAQGKKRFINWSKFQFLKQDIELINCKKSDFVFCSIQAVDPIVNNHIEIKSLFFFDGQNYHLMIMYVDW